MMHMNKEYSINWRIWRQLERIADAQTPRLLAYSHGSLAGSAIERGHEAGELGRLLSFADAIADARLAQIKADELQ